MQKECKNSFIRLKELIEKEKKSLKESLMLDDIQPEIHQLDGAVLVQYFHDWISDSDFSESESDNEFEYLHKTIEMLSSNTEIVDAKLCYNRLESIRDFNILNDKTLIMLDGCAEIYQHKDDRTTTIHTNSIYEFKQGDVIDFKTTCANNYYVLITNK